MNALEKYLQDEYIVIVLDFQLMGSGDFADEGSFVKAFAGMVSSGCPQGLTSLIRCCLAAGKKC